VYSAPYAGGVIAHPRLLALDVDGTLLSSHGTILPATLEALGRARARGLIITLATGRRLSTAHAYIDALGVTVPVILQSGAHIVDPRSGDILYSNPLPPDVLGRVVPLFVAEGVQPILYEDRAVDQRLLTGPVGRDSAAMRPYLAARPDLVRRLPYDELARVGSVLECAAIDALPIVERVAARLELEGCRALVSYSAALDGYFLEVFRATCSKGDALQRLAALLGVAMADVVAVGDNYNDREMLQAAGLGVAMANAEPEIRAVADRIIPSNDEDGIAALLAAFS